MLSTGTQLGRYEIAAPLGTGGMGEVYRATDSRLDRQVAIKVLPPQFVQDQARLARFEREAKAVASLSHPNILGIHDFGTEQGQTFAVMELLEGETLRGRVAHGAIPWRKAVEIAVVIADGLAAAHAKGIIHRDLKPENIFLTSDGHVKILDFGLARIDSPVAASGDAATGSYHAAQTDAGTILGTVGYMSPEQVRGRAVDGKSDVFSLGCVLYEMVTGGRAFARESAVETMAAILHDDPPELMESVKNVPLELDRLIRHCLEKNPEQRFQSARDLAFALKAILSDSNISSPPMLAPSAARSPLAFRVVAACVLLGITVASAFLLVPRLRDGATTTPASRTGQLFDSLAILPLANVTGDPKGEPLCEGLAEHLSGRLSQVGALKVRPITSTARYRGQQADAKTVGRELNVNAVVTGRLRQDGETLVISLNLVDARDDSLVWSKSYPGNRQQILDLQDDIARDLASKLGLHPTSDEQQRLTKRHTENPSAYMLFTEGKFHFNKFTPDGLQTATEFFLRALNADPNYAPAIAGVARCKVLLGTLHVGPKQTHPEARQLFLKALEIDANLADAHAGLGAIHLFHDWDWPAAERELKLASANSGWLSWPIYGFWHATQGRLPEALEAIKRGQELDPAAAPRRNELAMCYNWMGRYAEAIVEANKALELDAKFPLAYTTLGVAHVQQGKPEQAIVKLQAAIDAGQRHPGVTGMLAYAYAAAGQTPEAQTMLQQLTGLSQGRFGVAIHVSRIHAALGDKDRAFEWLQRARDERDPHVIWLKVDPTFDSLRSDDRFDAILQEMRLADSGKPTEQRIDSVAVLPFTNETSDPEAEAFCDGIPEHVTGSLAQVRGRKLKVLPPTSTAHYKGQKIDPRGVSRELDAHAVVTARLRLEGDGLVIPLEMVDARNNNLLLSKQYKRNRNEVLILQDEIARDVATALDLQLTTSDQQKLTRRYTNDPEAYSSFLEGRRNWDKFTEEGMHAAVKHFQAAIDKDPQYALAYAWQSHAYNVLALHFHSAHENWPKGKKAAAQALLVDETVGEAHAALGAAYLFYDYDWPAAGRELRRALELDPTANSRVLHSFHLWTQGRRQEALVEAEQTVKNNPFWPIGNSDLARSYINAGQYEQAEAQAKKTLEVVPNFHLANEALGYAYLQMGKYSQAIAAFQKALEGPQDNYTLGYLGHTQARAGDREAANRALQQLKDLPETRSTRALALAMVQAGLGDKDEAFRWLRQSFENRDGWLIYLHVEPVWASLRNDPRFTDLLRDMGLADKAAARDQPIDTLAVLPFDNQSADPEAGYLGDDITYSLTDSLMRVRELKVRPYGSAARYKPGSFAAKTAGRELQAQAVLRGSIQKRGEDVLIEVELMHVSEDRRLWGNRYPGKLADRLALQQQIIQEVPEQLRLTLTGQEKQALAKLPTQSLKAHELYTLGRLAWNRRNAADIQKAIEYFEQAIDLDPNYALAYAGLADCYVLTSYSRESPQLARTKARDAALKALELDQSLAEPRYTLATIQKRYRCDFTGAERSFQLALMQEPHYATGRSWYGFLLSCLGRHDEAVSQFQLARQLDPDSMIIRAALGRALYMARKFDAAEAEWRATLAKTPHFIPALAGVGAAYLQEKRYPEAIQALRDVWERDKNFAPVGAWLGYAYGISGDAPRAREVLQEIQQLAKQVYVSPLELSVIQLGLGEKEEALTLLEQGYREQAEEMIWIKVDPIFDSLRNEPRFQKIIADIKFPP